MNPVREGLARTGLYHSLRLPDGRVLEGAMPLEYLEDRWTKFQFPADLNGLRALDVGPWDGYFTFELERRGAEVTAIDYVDLDTFRKLYALMGSRARYERLDVYDVSPERLGHFDIVLLLGVLYHLKHPLLALERVCAITRDCCIVDTFVIDPQEFREGKSPAIPYAEFYEHDELGGQIDNWCGPTVSQVLAWIRAAGFASADILNVTGTTVCVRANRHWRDLPAVTEPPLVLHGINSPMRGGRTFRAAQEEYLAFWCAWPSAEPPPLDTIYPEVDGFGTPPIYATVTASGLLVNTRLPPGLAPGQHHGRLRIGGSDWSAPADFYVDLPVSTQPLAVHSVQDGITFAEGQADWANGGWVTLWLAGLTPEAEPGNVTVLCDDVPHTPHAVAGAQVNFQLRPLFAAGEHQLVVEHRGQRSPALAFRLSGETPAIKGF